MEVPYTISQYFRKSKMRKTLNKQSIKTLVKMVDNGSKDKAIGRILNVSPDTVASYRNMFCDPIVPKDKMPPPPVEGIEDNIVNPPAKKAKAKK